MAFFSYSTIDWDAEAEKEVLHKLPGILESQIQAEIGSRNFKIWRDQRRLRWGDDWQAHIEDSINKHDAMIILVSPSWFKSTFCQQEFKAFVRAPSQKKGLLLPILWRNVPLNSLNSEQRTNWDLMSRVSHPDWTELCNCSHEDRLSILRKYCSQAAKKLQERKVCSAQGSEDENTLSCGITLAKNPSNSTIVSGGFALPSQGGGWATLKLVVSPLAALETDIGELVFSISGFTLVAEVSGAKIKKEAVRFGGAGFEGDVAHVYRAPSQGANTYALTIVGNEGLLAGEPLTDEGEAGHVELFEVEPEGEVEPRVSGKVELNPRSIDIDDEESMLDDEIEKELSAADKNARRIKRKLAQIVVEKCKNRISLLSSDSL